MSNALLLSEDDTHASYSVAAPLEIMALLRSMQEQGTLIRMHVHGRPVAIITTILEINTADQTVIIDNAIETSTNQRIIDADTVMFEALLDKIRIRFSTTKVSACVQNNLPALCIAIPATVIRMQRRDFFRVGTPIINPAKCTIQLSSVSCGANIQTATLVLEDISSGGLLLIDDDGLLDNTAGTTYHRCNLDLPETGSVTVSIQVVHCLDATLPNEKSTRRIGCAFTDLPSAPLNTIQRYIGRLERKLNAKRQGFE